MIRALGIDAGARRRAEPANALHLEGKRFGRLLVLNREESTGDRRASRWVARCDCGTTVVVKGHYLTAGSTKSCGCLRRDKAAATARRVLANTAAKFWAGVDKSGGPDACWPWLGALNANGYGKVTWGGRTEIASRVAWRLTHGADPGHFACHRCDNPPCCNPAHLFDGTVQENTDDMISKGRAPRFEEADRNRRARRARGERNPSAKIGEAQAVAVLEALRLGESTGSIARRLGLHRNSIWNIKSGATWAHLRKEPVVAADGEALS